MVSAGDASEEGGGVTASTALTGLGAAASSQSVRGEMSAPFVGHGVLALGLFDGIGALRVALDVLHAPLVGYISVESDQACWRVLESHFPSASHVDRVGTSVLKWFKRGRPCFQGLAWS